jgi:glycerol-3-phosphate dehydrogenase
MAGARNFVIKPRKGEYFLLDNNVGNLCKHTIFQTPDAFGKGVLVTPTVDGNILVGPSAEDTQDKTNTSTSRPFQDLIMDKAEKSIPNIPRRNIINSFAGVRAIPYDEETGKKISDFIIEEDANQKGFINVAGICSPGLTAAPAIGKYVADLLKKSGLKLTENKDFIPIRKGIDNFFTATPEKQQQLIEENPLYGRIICRCEMITEAEIVKAVHSTIGAKDLDGIKRRVRAGMGRCQSGFCSPKITAILSRELNIPLTSVTKMGGSSYILNTQTR